MRRNLLFLDSVTGLRKVVRRMFSASSVFEILMAAAESAAENFKGAEVVGVYQRMQSGHWEYPVAFDEGRASSAVACLHDRLRIGLTPAQIDESMLNAALTAPGDVGSWRELLACTSIKRHIDSALEAEGFGDADCLASRVSSGDGVDVTIFVSCLRTRRIFSDRDRAMLGALADVTSIAARST